MGAGATVAFKALHVSSGGGGGGTKTYLCVLGKRGGKVQYTGKRRRNKTEGYFRAWQKIRNLTTRKYLTTNEHREHELPRSYGLHIFLSVFVLVNFSRCGWKATVSLPSKLVPSRGVCTSLDLCRNCVPLFSSTQGRRRGKRRSFPRPYPSPAAQLPMYCTYLLPFGDEEEEGKVSKLLTYS